MGIFAEKIWVAFANAKASSFCKCKSYSQFFSKNICVYAIFNDQSLNDMLTNNIVSLEQLGPAKETYTNVHKHTAMAHNSFSIKRVW